MNEVTFESAYSKLPNGVKTFITNELPSIFLKIEQKYHLHVDIGGKLANMAGDTVVGILPPTAFIEGVKKMSEIPNESKESLINDFEILVFKRVRDILTTPYSNKTEEEVLDDELPEATSIEFTKNTLSELVPTPSKTGGLGETQTRQMIPVVGKDEKVEIIPQLVINSTVKSPPATLPTQNNGVAVTVTKPADTVITPTQQVAPKKTADPYREPIDM